MSLSNSHECSMDMHTQNFAALPFPNQLTLIIRCGGSKINRVDPNKICNGKMRDLSRLGG